MWWVSRESNESRGMSNVRKYLNCGLRPHTPLAQPKLSLSSFCFAEKVQLKTLPPSSSILHGPIRTFVCFSSPDPSWLPLTRLTLITSSSALWIYALWVYKRISFDGRNRKTSEYEDESLKFMLVGWGEVVVLSSLLVYLRCRSTVWCAGICWLWLFFSLISPRQYFFSSNFSACK